MNPKKVANILGVQYPNSKNKVRSFLAMVEYYRAFIPGFAGIAQSLFATLKDGQPESFEVSQDIKNSVDCFNEVFSQNPILQYHRCFEHSSCSSTYATTRREESINFSSKLHTFCCRKKIWWSLAKSISGSIQDLIFFGHSCLGKHF